MEDKKSIVETQKNSRVDFIVYGGLIVGEGDINKEGTCLSVLYCL